MLDGACRIDELLDQAAKLKMPALAVTEHGNMFSAIAFHDQARQRGIRPILGCEVYVAPGSRFEKSGTPGETANHLVLLAETREGFHNLIKLVSAGYTEGFYYKPRIDKELLARHGAGLIGLSSCLKGEVATELRAEQARKALAAAATIYLEDEIAPPRIIKLVREQGKGGDPIVRQKMAQLYIAEQALQMIGYRSLTNIMRGGHPGPEGSTAKLVWSQTDVELAQTATEVLGPYSQLEGGTEWAPDDGQWEFYELLARASGIRAGTTEILKNQTTTYTLDPDGIPIAVGSTVELDVTLKVSTLAETITVTGDAPVVNASAVQVSTSYNKELVQNAPVRRFSYFDLINSAPGVSQTSNLGSTTSATSLGSSTNENSYQIDGTDISSTPWPNTDAVEEVEVLQLGASAEYGNVQGAVFNIVTRMGGNVFHGDANFYHQSEALTGRNTTDAVDRGFPYHRDKWRDATVQATGPFVRDKFWFFGSLQYQRDWDSQPGVDPRSPSKNDSSMTRSPTRRMPRCSRSPRRSSTRISME